MRCKHAGGPSGLPPAHSNAWASIRTVPRRFAGHVSARKRSQLLWWSLNSPPTAAHAQRGHPARLLRCARCRCSVKPQGLSLQLLGWVFPVNWAPQTAPAGDRAKIARTPCSQLSRSMAAASLPTRGLGSTCKVRIHRRSAVGRPSGPSPARRPSGQSLASAQPTRGLPNVS